MIIKKILFSWQRFYKNMTSQNYDIAGMEFKRKGIDTEKKKKHQQTNPKCEEGKKNKRMI